MANLFDYINWRGDLEFYQSPFNPVDNIIFSQLSYLPMDGIVPGSGERGSVSVAEAAALYAVKQRSGFVQTDDATIIDAGSVISSMGTAPRYKNCRLFGYESHIDQSLVKQFSAYCALIRIRRFDRIMLVVYRGTDMSLIGWKEDLNMSYKNSVPSQKEAVLYLEKMARRFTGPIVIAGHSKGGNLAIFAAAFCRENTRRRIAAIYSNDAPGFQKQVIMSKGYQGICGRIQAFIPQDSFVGMLFEHGETPLVVKSTVNGPAQHNICTWEVTRNNMAAGELSPQSRLIDNIIRDWIEKLDEGQRQQFIEAIFRILISTNANSISDLTADWKKAAVSIIGSLKNIDSPTKKFIGKIIGDLFRAAGKNIRKQRTKQ